MPYNLDEVGLFDSDDSPRIDSKYINHVWLADEKDIVFQMGFGKHVNKALRGGFVVFSNIGGKDSNIVWECISNIEKAYLPSSCSYRDVEY